MGTLMLAAGLLVLSMLFGTANLSLRGFSRRRLAEALEPRGKLGWLDAIDADLHAMVLTTSIIRHVGNIVFTLCMVSLVADSNGAGYLALYAWAAALSVALVMIFGVGIPNAWARYGGETYIAAIYPVLRVSRTVLGPAVAALQALDGLVRRLAGIPANDSADPLEAMEQEILDAVSEGEKLGAVDEQEKEMIESVIEFGDTQVGQVMTPRTEIVAIQQGSSFDQARTLINREGHSRVPVYTETIDSVQGVLYAKDLLQVSEPASFELAGIMRSVPFIPETMTLRELFRQFREDKVHMAIILDEYGGTAGLVTLEDLLEELVGEIVDEYEPNEPKPIERIDDGQIEIDARVRIHELNDELDLELPEDDDYDTIGGFVFSTLGRIPRTGEQFDHGILHIEVVDAEERRINRLRIRVSREEQAPS